MLATWAHYALRRRFDKLAAGLGRLATALHPRDPDGWLVRARVYGTLGRDDLAEVVMKAAVRRIPSSLELKTELAERLIYQGKTAQARGLLNELSSAERESAAVVSGLAHAAYQEGDHGAARELALNARSRVDDGATTVAGVLVGIGALLAGIPGAEDEAIETLKLAAEREPADPRAHMILAALLAESDEHAASRHAEMALPGWGGGRKTLNAELESLRKYVRRGSE